MRVQPTNMRILTGLRLQVAYHVLLIHGPGHLQSSALQTLVTTWPQLAQPPFALQGPTLLWACVHPALQVHIRLALEHQCVLSVMLGSLQILQGRFLAPPALLAAVLLLGHQTARVWKTTLVHLALHHVQHVH